MKDNWFSRLCAELALRSATELERAGFKVKATKK